MSQNTELEYLKANPLAEHNSGIALSSNQIPTGGSGNMYDGQAGRAFVQGGGNGGSYYGFNGGEYGAKYANRSYAPVLVGSNADANALSPGLRISGGASRKKRNTKRGSKLGAKFRSSKQMTKIIRMLDRTNENETQARLKHGNKSLIVKGGMGPNDKVHVIFPRKQFKADSSDDDNDNDNDNDDDDNDDDDNDDDEDELSLSPQPPSREIDKLLREKIIKSSIASHLLKHSNQRCVTPSYIAEKQEPSQAYSQYVEVVNPADTGIITGGPHLLYKRPTREKHDLFALLNPERTRADVEKVLNDRPKDRPVNLYESKNIDSLLLLHRNAAAAKKKLGRPPTEEEYDLLRSQIPYISGMFDTYVNRYPKNTKKRKFGGRSHKKQSRRYKRNYKKYKGAGSRSRSHNNKGRFRGRRYMKTLRNNVLNQHGGDGSGMVVGWGAPNGSSLSEPNAAYSIGGIVSPQTTALATPAQPTHYNSCHPVK